LSVISIGRTRWEGDLVGGSGVTSLDSGAAAPMEVTWKARSEAHDGLTSPEELIAAAHATCFSMAFSNTLAKNGTPPTSLDVEAKVTFVPGTGITTSELAVSGVVEGLSAEMFADLAETAKVNCPVSKALDGNVEITVTASLG
jgi:osmotically inducible protein OsmC